LYLTSDAGNHWSVRTAPTMRADQIAFANNRIGYAFGPTTWVTTDGARNWHQIPGRPTIALVADGAYAYRVTYRGSGCPGPCHLRVERAVTGSTVWRTVDVPPFSGDGAGLAASGGNLLVTLPGNPAGGAASAQTAYLQSPDGGATWHMSHDPCGGTGRHEWDTAAVALRGRTLASLCTRRLTQRSATVVSHDLGATWTARHLLPARWAEAIGISGAGSLIAAGMDSAPGEVMYCVAVSADGGATWKREVTSNSFAKQNPNYAGADIDCAGNGCAVLADPRYLFVTPDNGVSWAGPSLPK
jgi:hypothetical protein